MNVRFLLVTFFLLVFASNILQASEEYTWSAPIELRGDDYNNSYYGGSFVKREDGKFLVAYHVGRKVVLSVVDSEAALLTEENASAKNEWEFYTLYSSGSESVTMLQKLNNGRILLYLSEFGVEEDPEKPYKLTVYESLNGLGTDFLFKSEIYQHQLPNYTFGARAIGQAIEVDGTILLPFAAPVTVKGGVYNGTVTSRLYCVTSRNGGTTWNFSQIVRDYNYRLPSKGFGIANDRVIVLAQHRYGGGRTTMFSQQLSNLVFTETQTPIDENIPTWDSEESYDQTKIGDMVYSHIFWQPDGYTYLLRDSGRADDPTITGDLYWIYRRRSSTPINLSGQNPYQLGSLGSGATWEGPLNPSPYGDDGKEFFSVTPSGHLALYGTSYYGGGAVSGLYAGMADPTSKINAVVSIIMQLLLEDEDQ